ncbi:MAG TPA: RsmD family RNA methyltransferase [Pyrinomonadaceae bacterium]|nr:RsmD family RNA methyltransferase [Pyrinomonadaceae bacterium]
MENRRPPRSNSSGRKPYFDRGQGAPPYRGGKFRSPDGNKQQSSRSTDGNTADGRGQDRGRRNYDPQRSDRPQGKSNFKRNDGHSGYGGRKFQPRPGQDRNRPGGGKRPPPVENLIKITSDAQITDGKFRGQTLVNSDSPYTVPTPRKVRDVTFKIIARRVKARRFLDLGAGVGTIGIEAISRGAMLSTFVERSARCCNFIRKNLDAVGIKGGHGELVEMEILPFLKKSAKRKRFWEFVYLDLPECDERTEILDRLSKGSALSPGGLLLIEHASDAPHPENLNKLKRWRVVDQGETIVSIYERI